MSLVERCKTKYQKRKVLYNLAGVMALTFAVATITHGVVKRNCVPRLLDVVDRPGTESTNSFSFFENSSVGNNNVITTNVYGGSKGHPGFVTRCLETGDIFETQGSAAEYYGIPPSILSNHLNRGVDLNEGLHFERLGVLK